jgi:hypothetical protein
VYRGVDDPARAGRGHQGDGRTSPSDGSGDGHDPLPGRFDHGGSGRDQGHRNGYEK